MRTEDAGAAALAVVGTEAAAESGALDTGCGTDNAESAPVADEGRVSGANSQYTAPDVSSTAARAATTGPQRRAPGPG